MKRYELLELVKKRYPPGTEFIPLGYEKSEIIPENPYYDPTWTENYNNEEVDESYDAVDEYSLTGFIYDSGKWAKIINRPDKIIEIW